MQSNIFFCPSLLSTIRLALHRFLLYLLFRGFPICCSSFDHDTRRCQFLHSCALDSLDTADYLVGAQGGSTQMRMEVLLSVGCSFSRSELTCCSSLNNEDQLPTTLVTLVVWHSGDCYPLYYQTQHSCLATVRQILHLSVGSDQRRTREVEQLGSRETLVVF